MATGNLTSTAKQSIQIERVKATLHTRYLDIFYIAVLCLPLKILVIEQPCFNSFTHARNQFFELLLEDVTPFAFYEAQELPRYNRWPSRIKFLSLERYRILELESGAGDVIQLILQGSNPAISALKHGGLHLLLGIGQHPQLDAIQAGSQRYSEEIQATANQR